jgi:hypothetical protein
MVHGSHSPAAADLLGLSALNSVLELSATLGAVQHLQTKCVSFTLILPSGCARFYLKKLLPEKKEEVLLVCF